MCVCAYPRVEFPSRLILRPYNLLSKRRHCQVERTTKELDSVLSSLAYINTHTHRVIVYICLVYLLSQWRHVDQHLYCYWSILTTLSRTTKNRLIFDLKLAGAVWLVGDISSLWLLRSNFDTNEKGQILNLCLASDINCELEDTNEGRK